MRIERSITIAASPERVFRAVADWRRHGRWQPTVESVEAPEELGLGSQLVEVRSSFGTRLTFDAAVIEFQPPSVVAVRGRSRGRMSIDVTETFMVTPEGEGARLTMTADGELPLLFRPMQAGIVFEVERQVEGGLKALKELVEAGD